jgi:hypothetical protein
MYVAPDPDPQLAPFSAVDNVRRCEHVLLLACANEQAGADQIELAVASLRENRMRELEQPRYEVLACDF